MPRINTEYREEAKKKIIDAAMEVAADDGWNRLTLDAIAQKVGVTKGALYAYFRNGRELMQDVFIMLGRKIRDHVVERLEEDDDIHVALESLADFIFLQPKPFIPIFLQALSHMPKNPALQKKVSALFDENSTLICAAMARYQKEGQIPREVNLRTAVQAIYPMTMGLAMITHVMGKDPKKARQTWIISVERILLIDSESGTSPRKK
jgi:AcrR family transcriptional regulator